MNGTLAAAAGIILGIALALAIGLLTLDEALVGVVMVVVVIGLAYLVYR